MRILIVTPARRGSRTGNRVTANRWARLLRRLGHKVSVSQEYRNQNCDLMMAIHASKSAKAILRFREACPSLPIVLLLAGTDLYRDIRTSKTAQRSLDLADRLVVLQSEGKTELATRYQGKCRVIYQSTLITKRSPPLTSCFEICVIGHLRPVKDPFRAALAARRLPKSSGIRVVHLGEALRVDLAKRAEAEMLRNPRYRWLGEVPGWKARKYLLRSRAMVLSSKLEGGANVVSDAVGAGIPILASKISGTIGQLGGGYCGYFPVGSTRALAKLMQEMETSATFGRKLATQVRRRRFLVREERELEALRSLISSVD